LVFQVIRPATISDGAEIYAMIEQYFIEAVKARKYPLIWSEESAKIFLGNLLYKPTSLSFVSENLEGVLLGEMSTTWFGPNLMGNPVALYVKPEHRNGLIARALIRAFENETRSRGGMAVSFDFWAGVTDNRIVAGLMNVLGYSYQGPIFYKIFEG